MEFKTGGEKIRTIQIIGTGNVGSAIAFGVLCRLRGVRLLITDKKREVQEAQYHDLLSSAMMLRGNRLHMADAITRADIYIVAAGCNTGGAKSKPSLLNENLMTCKDIFEKIEEINPSAWVIVVTNPSHALAQEGLMHLSKVIPVGKHLDHTRARMSMPRGKHESPWTKDVYQAIMSGKGHTAYGPAGEVLRLLEEIL